MLSGLRVQGVVVLRREARHEPLRAESQDI